MVSISNEFPEVPGFVSLYKAFPSLLQYLFSSLLLMRVKNFLSTALAWLNLQSTGEEYTGDKITFLHLCRKLYPVFLPLKDHSMMWTAFCTLIKKKKRQPTILCYFTFKRSWIWQERLSEISCC